MTTRPDRFTLSRTSWRVLRLVIPIAFVLSIAVLMGIGVYALKANNQLIGSFQMGEQHFRALATAATKASSYVKRAEGHLLMYLALHRETDKRKFPLRLASLQQQLNIIADQSRNSHAMALLRGMRQTSDKVAVLGQRLIALHDQAMATPRGFQAPDHELLLTEFHRESSLVRKVAVELAALEIELQTKTMHTAIGMATGLKETMAALIIFAGIFALGSGTVTYWFIVKLNREIEGRIRYEEQLQQSQARIRAMFDATADSALLLGPDSSILDINHIGARRRGLRPEQVIGRSWSENLGPELARMREGFLAQVFTTGQPVDFEEQIKGTYFSVRIFPVLDNRGQVVQAACYSRDISSQKLAQQERERLEAQLRQSQKMEAVGTLAGGIAHDFNNLLATIMGFCELAQEDAQKGRVNPDDLQQIVAAAERGKDLVQQILAFSRKQGPQLMPTSLNQVVEHTMNLLRRLLPKMILIEANLAAKLPEVLADATQLEQVIMTLATNARDAMPQGGTLTIATELVKVDQSYSQVHPELAPGDHAMLTISDDGTGMPPEVSEHIFEPFFTTKDVGKGTGLGLSVAYGIVRNHGGTIELRSRTGGGTVCEICLPVYRGAGDLPLAGQGSLPAEGLTGDETILLVDDVPSVRQAEKERLTRMGYRVLTADSGEEALSLYEDRGNDIGLVIMDLGMPGMGGHQAIKAILALNPQAKILVASGYAASDQVREAVQAGAAGYVIKPFHQNELLTTVRFLLDGK
ncbi:MAG: response regulator [Desulfarculaceae bacterium]|nr:response regulator [Desulfarculaceae bacterium]MCF8072036.1 response regulator [Desulfarculaceae bacterium]MCF8101553.1 response regulator [Desulfarculaceae bacterium]MCF8115103.1 response regulator [Desulfarculaceae bacterium]